MFIRSHWFRILTLDQWGAGDLGIQGVPFQVEGGHSTYLEQTKIKPFTFFPQKYRKKIFVVLKLDAFKIYINL